jgi:hypothetical protein
MTDLRTSLHRLADSTDPLPVDDDLWKRGQAARHRGQALVVAAVLAIIASVTWSAVLLGTDDREARTASTDVVSGGAIPSRIDDIPSDLEATSDLAVGRVSVAFRSATGDVVVITAVDGVPHRLDLGDWGPDKGAFVLSPDGSRLAYQRPADDGTRLAVLDLETGRPQTLLANPDVALEVDGLSWSPDGTWLGWVASAMGTTPAWSGVVRTDGSRSSRAVLQRSASSIAVSNDGDAAVGQVNGGLRLLPLDGEGEPIDLPVSIGVGAFSPDGGKLQLGTGPATASYTFDVRTRGLSTHAFPDGTLGESVVRPLGWVDDRLQVFLAQSVDGASRELVVTTPTVSDTSTWRGSVGSVGTTGIANSLSLAVDLVPDLDGTSSQRLTHDFGDPLPDQRRDISWLIGLGVAAAIAVLMALRWLLRRLLR